MVRKAVVEGHALFIDCDGTIRMRPIGGWMWFIEGGSGSDVSTSALVDSLTGLALNSDGLELKEPMHLQPGETNVFNACETGSNVQEVSKGKEAAGVTREQRAKDGGNCQLVSKVIKPLMKQSSYVNVTTDNVLPASSTEGLVPLNRNEVRTSWKSPMLPHISSSITLSSSNGAVAAKGAEDGEEDNAVREDEAHSLGWQNLLSGDELSHSITTSRKTGCRWKRLAREVG